MYFLESAAIVDDHGELQEIVERVDEHLAMIFASSPLRPADFACVIEADENQVIAVFELLVEQDLLSKTEMVECACCTTLMPATDFRQAVDDEDAFDCSGCGRTIHRRTQPTVLYRMSDKALERLRPVLRHVPENRAVDSSACVFQRVTDRWTIAFLGVERSLGHRVGMTHIASLLAKPDRDISVVDLRAAESGLNPVTLFGSSGELIDDDARRAYGGRLQEIKEEIEDARAEFDHARTERLELEAEAIQKELRTTTGFGGRARISGDVENARTAVTNAISRALGFIRMHHPELGKHLTKSISTGLTCRYTSDPGIQWTI
jgi:hypothetical protein